MNKITSIENRKARFEYSFVEEFTAGIVLQGYEIKSLRKGNADLSGAYCVIENGEVFLRNSYIASMTADVPHIKDRKLLLKRTEISKLERKLIKGMSIVPKRITIGRLAKVEIALAKGKKDHDKRETIKKRDIQRELARS